jgi:hypothetical protein
MNQSYLNTLKEFVEGEKTYANGPPGGRKMPASLKKTKDALVISKSNFIGAKVPAKYLIGTPSPTT